MREMLYREAPHKLQLLGLDNIMTTTGQNHSIETQIALLGVKLDANHQELKTELQAMNTLQNEQNIHLRQTFESHRTQNEKTFAEVHTNHEALKSRVEEIEKKNAENNGAKITHQYWITTLWGVVAGGFVVLMNWIIAHFSAVFHIPK